MSRILIIGKPLIPYENSKFIVGEFNGRLGNHLFIYASLLGISINNKRILYFKNDSPIFEMFKINSNWEKNIFGQFYCKGIHMLENGWGKYDHSFISLPIEPTIIYIGVYLQSFKYFEKNYPFVRNQLKLKEYYQNFVNNYYQSLKVMYNDRIYVSIHVRRGDMLSFKFYSLYKVIDVSYLFNAINLMIMRLGVNVLFIVSSDDYLWTKKSLQSIKIDSFKYVLLNNSLTFQESFAILSMANHSIISSGTFGWWIGWLTNGTVVYFKNFIQKTSKLYDDYKEEDYYPQFWIGI